MALSDAPPRKRCQFDACSISIALLYAASVGIFVSTWREADSIRRDQYACVPDRPGVNNSQLPPNKLYSYQSDRMISEGGRFGVQVNCFGQLVVIDYQDQEVKHWLGFPEYGTMFYWTFTLDPPVLTRFNKGGHETFSKPVRTLESYVPRCDQNVTMAVYDDGVLRMCCQKLGERFVKQCPGKDGFEIWSTDIDI